MPCPVCGKVYCDHTPGERGQTQEEMLKDMMNGDKELPREKSKGKKISKEKLKSEVANFEVVVDYNKSLAEMVKAGGYHWVSEGIIKKYFPIQGVGLQKTELALVHLNGKVKTKEIRKFTESKNLIVPKGIEHLLALGATYPEIQEEFPVVVLCDFLGPNYGDSVYPYLYINTSRMRALFLDRFADDHLWDASCRFLAVRK